MFKEEHGVLVLLPAMARDVENFAVIIEIEEVVARGVDSFEPNVCSLCHNHKGFTLHKKFMSTTPNTSVLDGVKLCHMLQLASRVLTIVENPQFLTNSNRKFQRLPLSAHGLP